MSNWPEFLESRARMIREFRDDERREWSQIARLLSCDPVQVQLIYEGTCGRETPVKKRRGAQKAKVR